MSARPMRQLREHLPDASGIAQPVRSDTLLPTRAGPGFVKLGGDARRGFARETHRWVNDQILVASPDGAELESRPRMLDQGVQ